MFVQWYVMKSKYMSFLFFYYIWANEHTHEFYEQIDFPSNSIVFIKYFTFVSLLTLEFD